MLNPNFFPTPDAVIDRMLTHYGGSLDALTGSANTGRRYLRAKRILEPSAGAGHIVDRLTSWRYDVNKKDVSVIESDPDLQAALLGKGYRLLETDFLKFNDPYLFDLIIMNPPFDEGAKHLLHAWDILKAGDIVCLLNAETIRNPHTEERKLLGRIIEQHGSVEFIGQAFKTAERPTDVEVALVRLHKPDTSTNPFEGVEFEKDAKAREDAFEANPLASRSVIASVVAQYEAAKAALTQLYSFEQKYRFYLNGIEKQADEYTKLGSLNERLDALKEKFWRYVFDKTRIGQQTTSNYQRKFQEAQQRTANLAFSEVNIIAVLELFFLNREEIMKECIVEAFDKATQYHEKNVVHTEGWKHNKSYKCAPKIILPYGIEYDSRFNHWSFYRSNSFFNDIDKALCFLSGKNISDIRTTHDAIWQQALDLNKRDGLKHDAPFESTFFTIRIYKKGTVHLIFKDADLLARFNQAAADGKMWVGAGY